MAECMNLLCVAIKLSSQYKLKQYKNGLINTVFNHLINDFIKIAP